MQNKKTDCKFILCPVCGNKTHTMIREDTELKNFLVPGAYERVLELRKDIPEIAYIDGAPLFEEYNELLSES